MQIAVKGHQVDVGDSLRSHIETALNERIGKYFADAVDTQVVISKDAYLFCAEVIVHPGVGGMIVQARASAADPYPAFDNAADRIAKRLQRYKSKFKAHEGMAHSEAPGTLTARKVVFEAAHNDDKPESEDPVVVAEMTTPLMTLTVSEAVMNLELGDMPALLFKNKADGGLNMLYRRTDGNIGWVDPASSLV